MNEGDSVKRAFEDTEQIDTDEGQGHRDPVFVCEAVKKAIEEEAPLVAPLRELNNSFESFEPDVIFGCFEEFDMFSVILSLARRTDLTIRDAALFCLSTFTYSSSDFVLAFAEQGLFTLLTEILHGDDMKMIGYALSIATHIVAMDRVLVRRVLRIVTHDVIARLLATKNQTLCEKIATLISHFLRYLNREEAHACDLLGIVTQMLTTDDNLVVEILLNGLTTYVIESSSFCGQDLLGSALPAALQALCLRPSPKLATRLCRLVGNLFKKKIDIGIGTQTIIDFTRSEQDEVRMMAFWCLNTGLIEGFMDVPLIHHFLLETCTTRKEDVFAVTYEYAHCMIALLKQLDYDDLAQFRDNHVFDTLVWFLEIDEPMIDKATVMIISRIFQWSSAHGAIDKAIEGYLAAHGPEVAQQLESSTIPEIATQGQILRQQFELHNKRV